MTIHGFLTNVADFGALHDNLDFYDKVMPFCLPGHDKNAQFSQFTVQNTIEQVMQCYDDLASKYDQVDVVGYSLGGALATYIASKRNVGKLVLIAPANKYFTLSAPLHYFKFFNRKYSQSYRNAQGDVVTRAKVAHKSIAPYTRDVAVSLSVACRNIVRYVDVHTLDTLKKLCAIANAQIETVGELHCPTLILYGAMDELVPLSSVEYVRKHFVNNIYNFYDDVGHAMLHTSKEPTLIADIVRFLK